MSADTLFFCVFYSELFLDHAIKRWQILQC